MTSVLSSDFVSSRNVDEPPDLRVGVLEEAGVDLGHAREEASFGPADSVSHFWHALEHRRQLGVLADDPQLLLPLEHDLAVLVPPHVELAFVLVAPLLRYVVGRVAGAEREVAEPRTSGSIDC